MTAVQSCILFDFRLNCPEKLLKDQTGHWNSGNIYQYHSQKVVQQPNLSQNQKQRQNTYLNRNHHTNHKITGQKSLSFKLISGNAVSGHRGKKDTACSSTYRQNHTVHKISEKIIVEHCRIAGKRNFLRQPDKVCNKTRLTLERI